MTRKTSKTFLADWLRKHMPTREQLEQNRYMHHLAKRSELWRMTRRSVPRGVAIGLLIGIFAPIPGIQMIGAALMCVPFGGNIPIAAGMTFLSNPATTPFILAGSLYVGNQFGFRADVAAFTELYSEGAGIHEWLAWLLSDAAPALMLGLFVISVVAASVGYLLSGVIWRSIVARRRSRRLQRAVERLDQRLEAPNQ